MPFRILTWNINGTSNQNQGPDQLASVMHRHNIDLAVLQEVSIGGCTLDAALTAQFGAGNYDLRYHVANPSLHQRTWVDGTASHLAPASSEEHYAIIRRPKPDGTYRITITNIQSPDYLNNVAVANWVGERHPSMRAGIPVMNPHKVRRLSRPPLVDPIRYYALGLRRPLRIKAAYHGHRHYIFCWHAPQGSGSGGPDFSGRDARPGYELWQRAGGGVAYPHTRVILAGDLNARAAGVTGLGDVWPQAVHPPPGNMHNDGVSHIYAKGVTLQTLSRPYIDDLANYSDHVALAAIVT